MTKTLLTLTALSVAAFGLAACESWPTSKAPGTYKSSSSHTDASGTKTSTDQTTHVYRDPSGDKKAVVETKTKTDPEGWFNSSTTKSTKSYN
jgi:hypothetical protein